MSWNYGTEKHLINVVGEVVRPVEGGAGNKLQHKPDMRRGDTSREWKFLEAEAGLDMLIAIWFVTNSGFSCLWKIPISSGPNQVVSRARVLLRKTCNM